MNKTEEILKRDSIQETENLLGKDYHDFNGSENALMMLSFMVDNQVKENHLKSIGDTWFNMPWSEFKKKLEDYGFVLGLQYDIKHDDQIDEVVIYYHKEKGLVIFADSYFNKKDVNGGELYGEIRANSEQDKQDIWLNLSSGGMSHYDNMVFETSHDVREGLFFKLSKLETSGKFLSQWLNKDRFLYFVDYVENKVEGYDYKKLTREKILKCPKKLQEIVGL